jgi:hypothetical protein
MKTLNILAYIIAAYLLVAVTYLLFFKNDAGNITNNYKKDSTIVYIKDSNVYHPKVSQQKIINPVQQFYYSGSDSTACDSIRKYEPKAENDSISITAKVLVHGKLVDAGISYRWLRPIMTIKTIREPYPVPVVSRAVFGEIKTTIVLFNKPLCISGNIGLIDKKGWLYSVGYNTDNQILVGVGKCIKKF